MHSSTLINSDDKMTKSVFRLQWSFTSYNKSCLESSALSLISVTFRKKNYGGNIRSDIAIIQKKLLLLILKYFINQMHLNSVLWLNCSKVSLLVRFIFKCFSRFSVIKSVLICPYSHIKNLTYWILFSI